MTRRTFLARSGLFITALGALGFSTLRRSTSEEGLFICRAGQSYDLDRILERYGREGYLQIRTGHTVTKQNPARLVSRNALWGEEKTIEVDLADQIFYLQKWRGRWRILVDSVG